MPPKNHGGATCTCKYCGRTNKEPNPWLPPELREQSGKEFLQFRRERGKECSSCCALIRSRKRAFYDDPDLEISIKNDPEKKDIFQTDLEEFELKKQEDARTKSQRQPTKRVEASHSTGFKMRMVMGYFWPVDVLKREKKRSRRHLPPFPTMVAAWGEPSSTAVMVCRSVSLKWKATTTRMPQRLLYFESLF